ncbi:MAG: N-acetylmuramoyl-L-alanine amidase [Sphingobacteriales bacterium]|nr:MAG: N-acetylmuramoyl-L-alanine amidase [Sphingobacteriales bacterium]
MKLMKSIKLLVFVLFTCVCGSVFAQRKMNHVVLDAGHGGKDPGAIGSFSKEKDIALAVTLKVRDILKKEAPQLRTTLTRDSDFFVELKGRHAIANKANADLFLSIHINSTAGTTTRVQAGTRKVKKGKKWTTVPVYKTIHNRSTKTSGTETYVLGLTRNDQKEKAIGEFGETIAEEPGLLDENDPTTAILIAQYSQAFLSRSVTLGSKVQQNFAKAGRNNLGVKQKSLEVLAGSAMPGVLIELGFINNQEEEAYMNSEAGQQALASAIATAILDYKKEVEKK